MPFDPPQSANEAILQNILGANNVLREAQSRIEALLIAIYEQGGTGGGGGTTNYNLLSNLPQINGVTLQANKTASALGLQGTLTFDNAPAIGSSNPVTSNGIKVQLNTKVDKVANKGLSTNDFTAEEKEKLSGIEAQAQVNIIESIKLNGEIIVPANKAVALNVITETVNNLQNYYLKTETYTQEEVNALINSISSLDMEIVDALPETDISTTTIYLVPAGTNNSYTQYAYINNAWAVLGSTQIDLSNYYTKSQIDSLLLQKQDVLTFDSAPTASSSNPATSGGIYSALAGKQDALTFDSVPTASSSNPVTSGGVYSALKNISVDVATTENPGIVKPDGETITVDLDGTIHGEVTPIATESEAGKVKPDGSTITVDQDGTIHGSAGIVPDEADFDFDDETKILSLAPEQRIFTGTKEQWDDVPTLQKTSYGIVNITNDENGSYEPVRLENLPDFNTDYIDASGIAHFQLGKLHFISGTIHVTAALPDYSVVFNSLPFAPASDQAFKMVMAKPTEPNSATTFVITNRANSDGVHQLVCRGQSETGYYMGSAVFIEA